MPVPAEAICLYKGSYNCEVFVKVDIKPLILGAFQLVKSDTNIKIEPR